MIRSSCQALRLPRLVLIPRAAASSGTLAMPVAAGGDEDEDKKGPGGGRDGDRSGRPGPAPFHQLLLHPARAAWRSSSRPPPAYLAEVRSGLLLRSGRTGRQLRRTHGRVVRAQAALASRRERERRDLANARYRGGGERPGRDRWSTGEGARSTGPRGQCRTVPRRPWRSSGTGSSRPSSSIGGSWPRRGPSWGPRTSSPAGFWTWDAAWVAPPPRRWTSGAQTRSSGSTASIPAGA